MNSKKFPPRLAILGILMTVLARPVAADIIGGIQVSAGDEIQHYVAALYEETSSQGGALCTASLLAQDIALTAAHCVSGGASQAVLLFGRSIHSKSPNFRRVTRSLVNRKWATHEGRGMDEGDIALVRFEGGLPPGYQAADLMESDRTLKKGQKVILAGYGVNNASTHAGAGVLRKGEVTLLDPRPGKTEMILDQTHGKGACHGDSGGPAYVESGLNLILAGVTNRGYPDGAPDDCRHDVVYTKVSTYYGWIQKGMQELRSLPAEENPGTTEPPRKKSRKRKNPGNPA